MHTYDNKATWSPEISRQLPPPPKPPHIWHVWDKQEASRPDSSATYEFGICLENHPKIPQKAEIWYLMKASGC